MPARRRRSGCLVPAALAACLIGACLVTVIGSRSVSGVGAPGPGLSALEQVSLAVYLAVRQGALEGPAGDPRAAASLDIEPGDDAGLVTAKLESLGIVDDPRLFLRYLRYRGLDTGIEAGLYEVEGSMSIVDLANLLQQATASRYTITIPEGWRREQVARALGELGLTFSAGEFLSVTRSAPPSWTGPPAGAENLEGFLFPDTYTLDPTMTPDVALELFSENFEARVDSELRRGFEAQGLTTFEAVTLASIVEREAILPEERPLIAAVFLNRLRLGIPLQADPTVQYALGWQEDDEWWKPVLTAEDLQLDSPYNTYRADGLPPGPIASPGLASLKAVAEAPQSPFLFFRAACDGSGAHRFATTFEEHVANGCP